MNYCNCWGTTTVKPGGSMKLYGPELVGILKHY